MTESTLSQIKCTGCSKTTENGESKYSPTIARKYSSSIYLSCVAHKSYLLKKKCCMLDQDVFNKRIE